MLALLTDRKSGQVSTYEVPAPELRPGGILVRTHYSAISAGTERATLELSSKSLLAKAKARPDLLKQLRDIYQPGVGMADAFGHWLEQVLGPRGLVVYDSSDPASKPLVSGVFARELSTSGQTATLAASAGTDLTARGYHAQVTPHDGSPALFHLDPPDGRRLAIRQHDGQFLIGEQQYPAAALMREAAERPSGFSPNVLLRPIVQDTLFPTISYVAGPNELAYLGQLRGVYEHFGRAVPDQVPPAARSASGAGRSRAERSPCGADSAGGRRNVRRRRPRH